MPKNISYTILARDRFSKVSGKIQRSMQKIQSRAKRMGQAFNKASKKMGSIGKQMSTRLTLPLIVGAGLALRAFNKQEKAISQVRIGIEATGGAAKRSLKDLTALATKLQQETLFGDEEILAGATSQLLTFTNIAGKEFDRTQQAVLDVATRLAAARGGAVELTSTAIMLGKALNDPVKNLGALGRSGIQFSKTQEKLIKHLSKTGKVAQAQRLILKELENQYGGSAKAAAEAGTGALTQLFNAIGDLNEKFGEAINKRLKPFAKSAKKIVEHVTKWMELNPNMAELIVIIGGLAAAIGPLLIGLGLIGPIIVKGLAFLSIPIGFAIAAFVIWGNLILKIRKNWKAVVWGFRQGMNWITGKLEWLLTKMEKIGSFFSINRDFKNIPGARASNPNVNKNPLANKGSENKFNGVLDINIRDKGKNVENVGLEKIGLLDVGLSRVGI